MRKYLIYLLLFIFIPFGSSSSPDVVNDSIVSPIQIDEKISACEKLYNEMNLEGVVNYSAFEQAIEGHQQLDAKNRDIVTLIDFSKPSTEERLYIFDLEHKKLLMKSLVSHGRNSGENYATSFSNENGSFKSSLGFYLTENTYQGKNGYSLVLDGLEKGINDRAKERAIVIHGAAYSNPSTIISGGRLGRSLGCPALPLAVSKFIINTIKGGTLLYIYADNRNYLAHTSILTKHHS